MTHISETPVKILRALAWMGASLFLLVFSYHLVALPNRWIIAGMIMVAAAIGFIVTRNRHLILLGVLIMSLPLSSLDFSIYFDEKMGGDYRIAASLVDVAIFGLLARFLTSVPLNARRPLRPAVTKWLIMGMLFVSLLSITVAQQPELTIFSFIRLLRMAILAWITAVSIDKPVMLRRVVLILLAVTIGESMLAQLQRFSGGGLGMEIFGVSDSLMSQELNTGSAAMRVGGTFGHPNRLAHFLDLVLPLALSVAFAGADKKSRAVGFATVILGGGALIATLSRASWIGVSTGFFLVFLWTIRQPALRERAFKSLRLVFIILVPLVLINIGTFIARFSSDDEGSFATRWPMAKVAIDIIKDHPLQGVGLGNYMLSLHRYGDPEFPFTFEQKVHTLYLLIAAESGIASLVLYVLLVIILVAQCVKLARKAPPDIALVLTGILGGVVAFSIHGFVDYIELGGIPILWFLIGLVFVCNRLIDDSRSPAQPGRSTGDSENKRW